MKKQTIYLDMDGTIANLYDQKDWLKRLQSEDTSVFEECAPMVTEEKILKLFPFENFDLKILSMTPKNASENYCEKVKEAKNKWLDKFFPNFTSRIYMKYGNNKNLKNSSQAILIDDSEEIRMNFRGIALNPKNLWWRGLTKYPFGAILIM